MAKELTKAQQRLVDQIVAAGLADEATASAAMGNPAAEQQVAAWKKAMGQPVKNLAADPPRWKIWDEKKREGRR